MKDESPMSPADAAILDALPFENELHVRESTTDACIVELRDHLRPTPKTSVGRIPLART